MKIESGVQEEHRNHLGVVTAELVSWNLSSSHCSRSLTKVGTEPHRSAAVVAVLEEWWRPCSRLSSAFFALATQKVNIWKM